MPSVPPARHLLRAKDLADARYADPLTVADLAQAAGLSPAHFSREFRRTFGESPHAYLLTRRLERAAVLLRNTDRSVAEICMTVGLSSVGSFTTSFSRLYGSSPTAYRALFPPAAAWAVVPACVARAYGRRPNRTFREDGEAAGINSVSRTNQSDGSTAMTIRIGTTQVWVHDQDVGKEFYTNKLGMELRQDVTMPELGGFRWLTVGPAGQDDVSIVLMAIPGPPVMDEATADQVRDLMGKGFATAIFLVTNDCQKSYEELSARGVEFTEPPEQRPYGVDAGFRDPSGNSFRLTQVLAEYA